MVNNFTNTNKTNIHHSPQTIEHMKGQDIWHWKSKICPEHMKGQDIWHWKSKICPEHMKGQDIWHWKSKIWPDLLPLNKTTHYHKNE